MHKIALLMIAFAGFVPTAFSQEEKGQVDAYTFVAISTGGSTGGRSASFDFRINRYTTDQEIEELGNVLKTQGQDGLRRAMEKLDVGRINLVGTTGTQIAVARKKQTPDGTIITIVTPRNMSFAELYNSGRSVDYPFGFLRLTLTEQGEGTRHTRAATQNTSKKK